MRLGGAKCCYRRPPGWVLFSPDGPSTSPGSHVLLSPCWYLPCPSCSCPHNSCPGPPVTQSAQMGSLAFPSSPVNENANFYLLQLLEEMEVRNQASCQDFFLMVSFSPLCLWLALSPQTSPSRPLLLSSSMSPLNSKILFYCCRFFLPRLLETATQTSRQESQFTEVIKIGN